MSSPNKKRRNCRNYAKSWKAGTRGAKGKKKSSPWKDRIK